MKAVASAITAASFVDITHDVRPHDVLEGAFILWSVAPHFPEGSVHCAVVDPGVGTKRRGLIISSGGQLFVGPDNGLLAPAARAVGEPSAYEIINPRYFRAAVSTTFHGRDVFAPVAAHLAAGVPPEEIGRPTSEWAVPELDFEGGKLQEAEGVLAGEIIYIDRFGNAVTNIRSELLLDRVDFDRELTLEAQVIRPVRLRISYGYGEQGELCVIAGSHGLIEISVREGSAEEELGLKVGQRIRLHLQGP